MTDQPTEVASATAREMVRLALKVAEQSVIPPIGGGTLLLITGSFAEYLQFLKEADIAERKAVYVHNLGGLSAFTPGPWTHVVLYGEYWLNPIFSDENQDTALFYLELHSDGPLDQTVQADSQNADTRVQPETSTPPSPDLAPGGAGSGIGDSTVQPSS